MKISLAVMVLLGMVSARHHHHHHQHIQSLAQGDEGGDAPKGNPDNSRAVFEKARAAAAATVATQ